MQKVTALKQLRSVGIAEGTSFLVLLLVAMPLKYVLHMPESVRAVGSVHGFLFVLYLLALVRAAFVERWKLSRVALGFLASIVPLGVFFFDRTLKSELASISPTSTTLTPRASPTAAQP